MNTIYRQLPKEMKNHGYPMRMIKRSDNAVIYSKAGGFEVMRILRHNGYEIKGVKIEPSEYLPSDEMFGKDGWYFGGEQGRERAEQKWREINE